MATLKNGILGGFSGKVGNVIGSQWKGIDYMRSVPSRRSTSNTAAQAEQRAKFAFVFRFIQNMRDILDIGFKNQAIRMTALNSALAYTLKNAIAGTAPDFSIAYNAVLVTRGSLPNATSPVVAPGAAGSINFSWLDNSKIGNALASDQCILVAFCEALNQTVFIVDAVRSAKAGVLSVPAFSGKVVQTWISFISEKRKDIATSIFTGELTVV